MTELPHMDALEDDYPELRAELLRLQAERDNLEATNNILRNQQLQMMFLRQDRDALLEVLRGIEAVASASLEEDEPKYLANGLRDIYGKARSMTANVEGKDD